MYFHYNHPLYAKSKIKVKSKEIGYALHNWCLRIAPKRRQNAKCCMMKSPALFGKTAEQRWSKPYREMTEESNKEEKEKGKGKRKQQHSGLDGGDMSPSLFNTVAKRRLMFKHSEMTECSIGDTSIDRISLLPDELLGSILSRISLKEHIATSILSRRWRYLWTSTNRLDFDGIDSILSIGRETWEFCDKKIRDEVLSAFEKVKLDFLSMINQFLASRGEGSAIKDFRVHFDLVKEDEGYISEWLRYALACKVQRLELNLYTTLLPQPKEYQYVLPDTFFAHVDEEVGSNPNRIHFKQLKTISLNRVGVDGKGLEFFLRNCPLLEDLSVSNSSKLLSLRVNGPFPSLKRLEISYCAELKSLEICDVNLVCFKYRGWVIHFLLRNLPMLAHLSVSKSIFEYMRVNVAHFSSILKQLEIFHVDIQHSMTSFLLPVEMSNLRQLEVMASSDELKLDESLLWLADLIRSAPRVEKFVLESGRLHAKYSDRELQRNKIGNLYPHLKEVEFAGFVGVPSDLEFVFHIVDNAAAVKKILVDTKKTHERLRFRKYCINRNEKCRVVLNQLKKQLAVEKPGIKLECQFTPI